ncbi:hypothetical protein M0802_000359 [Mischocyttarus mexicanus]|nr:hypothetical protein M0802_000359 [Mischocyttarus mexicanus]
MLLEGNEIRMNMDNFHGNIVCGKILRRSWRWRFTCWLVEVVRIGDGGGGDDDGDGGGRVEGILERNCFSMSFVQVSPLRCCHQRLGWTTEERRKEKEEEEEEEVRMKKEDRKRTIIVSGLRLGIAHSYWWFYGLFPEPKTRIPVARIDIYTKSRDMLTVYCAFGNLDSELAATLLLWIRNTSSSTSKIDLICPVTTRESRNVSCTLTLATECR